MPNDALTTIRAIATDLLPGQEVEVTANGEDYYTIAGTRDGRKSNFPPVWFSPSATEQQIKDKLKHEFAGGLNPGSADPDDLSVPNLQNEGRKQRQ